MSLERFVGECTGACWFVVALHVLTRAAGVAFLLYAAQTVWVLFVRSWLMRKFVEASGKQRDKGAKP